LDSTLVKITGALAPSGIPVVEMPPGKADRSNKFQGRRGSRSKGGGRGKKSQPHPPKHYNSSR